MLQWFATEGLDAVGISDFRLQPSDFSLPGALVLLACLGAHTAFSADLYHEDGLDVRWDNTLRYTAAVRAFSRDSELVANPNWDDGDRNFDPGLISNRLDLLSELEVTACSTSSSP